MRRFSCDQWIADKMDLILKYRKNVLLGRPYFCCKREKGCIPEVETNNPRLETPAFFQVERGRSGEIKFRVSSGINFREEIGMPLEIWGIAVHTRRDAVIVLKWLCLVLCWSKEAARISLGSELRAVVSICFQFV